MHYKLIVNQPFQSVRNVLGATFRFLNKMDPGLKRLEDSWRLIQGGIAIRDRFNARDIPIGVEVPSEDVDSDNGCFFQVNGFWYIPDNTLSRSNLDDFLQVINDHYGKDLLAIFKSDIGYGYFKAVNESS